MSRLRTGLKPDDWLKEEPRSAHVVSRGGSLAVGTSAAEMARQAKAHKLREKAT